jgi:ankyrin repeat protein
MKNIVISFIACVLVVLCLQGKNPFHEAQSLGRELIIAAREGDIDQVTHLLARGANINTKDKTGRTALMKAVTQRQEAVVKLLVRAGAYINEPDRRKNTALDLAEQYGTPSIQKYLLDNNGEN